MKIKMRVEGMDLMFDFALSCNMMCTRFFYVEQMNDWNFILCVMQKGCKTTMLKFNDNT